MVQKIAYLTIDDAPSADFSRKVNYLHAKGIPAVFFCLGEALEQYPNPVVEAIQKGFVIGSHAYHHKLFSEFSLDECLNQISMTHEVIERLYLASGIPWEKKYFRFPYGDKGGLRQYDVFSHYEGEGAERKQAIQDHLRKLGYSQPTFKGITYQYYREADLLEDVDWHWTYDVREWGLAIRDEAFGVDTLEKVFARMDEDDPEGCRGLNYPDSEEIVLMHDHVGTTHVFAIIIERLLDMGLQFRLPD
jgi:peptidoglycan/xylan/chitin deacetylase (PgdA/CDA1 family)